MSLGRHHVIIGAGLVVGVLLGVFVFDTDPAVMGWLFGLGLGLSGGAFVAALASGEMLAGGGGGGEGGRRRRARSDAPWLEAPRPDEDDPDERQQR